MPSPTFYNLPQEKRDAFLDAAFAEFGSREYEKASVSNMVRTLNIAKGSVYQYFQNKKELYTYLLEIAQQARERSLKSTSTPHESNFFKWFRELQLAELAFARDFPAYRRLLQNATRETHHPDLDHLPERLMAKEVARYRKALKKQQKKGKLRQDLTVDLMAQFLVGLNSQLPHYLQAAGSEEELPNPKKKSTRQSIRMIGELAKSALMP